MGETPTEPVTILFTDIEGSTRQWENDPLDMEAALRRHDEVLRGAITSNGGRVFTAQGDGFGAVFEDARHAAAAARVAQRGLHDEPWPGSIDIRVRMGLHTGVAWPRDGDYFGPSVNRAARLMAAGHGRQILVSDAARATLDADELVDLGEHRLKDLSAPEHIWQLAVEGIDAEHPPIRTLDLVATNLPVKLSSFVGRDEEVEQLTTLLDTQRLVTLTGMGGVGKTRLALQVAAEASHRFPEGVWFVELAPVRPGSGVGYQFVEAMGETVHAGSTPLDAIVGAIGTGSVLLVVDNCEHVLDDVRALVVPILGQCPDAAVVASSLEPLGVDGEYVYAVSPLATGGAESPALRLFIDRAEAANAGFDRDGRKRGLIGDICTQLDGLPLALELAAARARSMTPEDLADRLDQRFRLLRGSAGNADERHQTLLTTIDWAYELLTPDEQTMFNRLSIFRGPFPLGAVEQVCCDERIDELDAVDLLGRLVDRSMVVADLGGQHANFRMLESLRQYGRERLGEEVTIWRERSARYHGEWIGGIVDRLRTSDEPAAIRELDSSWGDLRAAVQWATHFEDAGLLARLIGDLAFEAMFRSRREVGEWARAGLDLVDGAEPEVATALLGVASASAGEPTRTVELGERFLELVRERPETIQPQTLLAVGLSMHLAGDSERPGELYDLAEQSGRVRGDQYVECPASSLRSLFYAYTDRPEQARTAALLARKLLDARASVTTSVGVQICDALRAEDPPGVLLERMEEAIVAADSVRCELISNVAKMVLAGVRGSLGELSGSRLDAADTLEHQRKEAGGGLVVSQQLRRAAVLMLRSGDHRPALTVLAFLEGHATPQANPGTQRELEELLPQARADLGEAAAAEAAALGASLSQTQVIDLTIETLRGATSDA